MSDGPIVQPWPDAPASVAASGPYFGRAQFRVSLSSLETGETIEAQFVPPEFEESLEAGYNALEVPGLSHRPLQFGSTSNLQISVELYFNAYNTPEDLRRLETARKFLQAALYPRRAENVASGAPTRLLFVWPGIVSLTCVLRSLTIKHSRFNREGQSVQFIASLALEEFREGRVYAEQIREVGSVRDVGMTFDDESETGGV